MGLDATAYSTATLLEPHERTDDCWDEHRRAYIIDPDFHRSLRGLVSDRCYAVEGSRVRVSNSYGGHGHLRRELARVFLGVEPEAVWRAPDDYADRPFFELIHFADNEGTIGPEAAADLAADFAAGREQFRAEVEDHWNRAKYDEWAAAFTIAAHHGLVDFS